MSDLNLVMIKSGAGAPSYRLGLNKYKVDSHLRENDEGMALFSAIFYGLVQYPVRVFTFSGEGRGCF